MNKLLTLMGRHGPIVLFVGVFIGLLAPQLAELFKPLMGGAVFVFTMAAFLKVDMASFNRYFARPGRAASALLWNLIGVPLVAWLLVKLVPMPVELRIGILLCMLAPPVGSAASIAVMLNLNPALAMIHTIALSLLCPFILPAAALALGGIDLRIDVIDMTMRLAVVVVGAALAALALRRFAGDAVRNHPQAITGISVLGLVVVAIGAMDGMLAPLTGQGVKVLGVVTAAFLVNAGFQILGTLLFAGLGRRDAFTLGLVTGNRNITLIWVAVAPWLAKMPGVEIYLAASVFPIFVLPLFMQMVYKRLLRNTPDEAPASTTPVATPSGVATPSAGMGPAVAAAAVVVAATSVTPAMEPMQGLGASNVPHGS